jgi:secondary thiamine-phosphate synthase enzyme
MEIRIKTNQQEEVIDLSNKINVFLEETGADQGVCVATVAHTTCALTTADLDPGTDKDLLEAVRKIFPKGDYRHPHNPDHVGDHIMSSIIGPSVSVPVNKGELKLGTWQRVVLVELNGPRERTITFNFISSR